tara:strand:+ start:1966 stop:3096 length:1131 start_codon:yes stop_codon:yes gene_type:complete
MSISPIDFYRTLSESNVEFFTGVPDSLLKEFCLCIDKSVPPNMHVITANEGNAIALASGFSIAKQSIPLVYMQNSGFGNAINPLLSLCNSDVYSIPLLLMIGWRGEPGIKDEPQHMVQGKVQIKLMELMQIPYEIISGDDKNYSKKISNLIKIAKRDSKPVALLIKKGTFSKHKSRNIQSDNSLMMREEVLEIILDLIDKNTIVVSTTGKTSREIFEIRQRNSQSHERDFLTVGSMGHCSSIAMGIALAKPKRKVLCIDGDGAMLMHLGALTSLKDLNPKNFKHILLNNEAHESVGGQHTAAKNIDLNDVMKSFGVVDTYQVKTKFDLEQSFLEFMEDSGPSFMEVKINIGSRKDLGRPNISPKENKKNFEKFLNN